MAPYPKLGKRVVYTAWQRMLSCQGFQQDALTGAQAKWAGMNGVAPERAAFNTPGSGVLAGTGWQTAPFPLKKAASARRSNAGFSASGGYVTSGWPT